MENKYLKRINELAAAAGKRALTAEETAEREELRRAYLAEFRRSFENILDSAVVKYPDGKKVPLSRKNK